MPCCFASAVTAARRDNLADFGHFTKLSQDIAAAAGGCSCDIFCRMTNITTTVNSPRGAIESLKDRRNWSSDQFFVHLRQLPTNDHRAIPGLSLQLPECFANAVRSLEEHDGATNGLGTLKPFRSGF